jgi:hypothetical protein
MRNSFIHAGPTLLEAHNLKSTLSEFMDDEMPNPPPSKTVALISTVSRNRTLRVKLATSLRREAELIARSHGVSLSYLVNNAIEEKITRFRQTEELRRGRKDGMHLVGNIRKTG